APSYISDLLTPYSTSRPLRSSNMGLMAVPPPKLTVGKILIFCIKCKLSHKCYKMQFSGFFVDILFLTVKIHLLLQLQITHFFASGQTCEIGRGSNTYFPHCTCTHTRSERCEVAVEAGISVIGRHRSEWRRLG